MSATALLSTAGEIDLPARASPETATRFLTLAEGRIAYTDVGTGPLVVLLPSLGDLKEEYRFLAPSLLAAGYRVVAMDLRGLGKSSTGWRDHAASSVGRDLVALLRHLNAGPAAIIGTSLGAGAAAWAAAEAPDTIRGLVLIGPFVRDVPIAPWWKALLLKALIKVAFVGPWAVNAWGAYYASLYPTTKPEDFDAYKAKLLANLAEPGRMAATRAMMNGSKADVAARLAAVKAPTLVVMGSKDPDFSDAAAEAATVARLMRGSFVMVDRAGHYPHAEMPEVTSPLVLDFLAGKGAA